VYVGDLDPQVNEALLWELFLQAGPVVNVHIPKDKLTQAHMGYGFVEFHNEEDADYAMKIMNMIKMFGKPIRVNKASRDKKTLDVGANLFIGNLDPDVDEKLLYDTFGAFGVIIATPKIMRDPDTGVSKGFGFVSYDNFESSDAAIEAMNSQYLCNRPIHVSYALKKDSKGERHGSQAERLLAASNPNRAAGARPNTLFAATPGVPNTFAAAPAGVLPPTPQISVPVLPQGMMPRPPFMPPFGIPGQFPPGMMPGMAPGQVPLPFMPPGIPPNPTLMGTPGQLPIPGQMPPPGQFPPGMPPGILLPPHMLPPGVRPPIPVQPPGQQ
jgi:splicing factor 3B subunit 4